MGSSLTGDGFQTHVPRALDQPFVVDLRDPGGSAAPRADEAIEQDFRCICSRLLGTFLRLDLSETHVLLRCYFRRAHSDRGRA
jgi:hypothetical protein